MQYPRMLTLQLLHCRSSIPARVSSLHPSDLTCPPPTPFPLNPLPTPSPLKIQTTPLCNHHSIATDLLLSYIPNQSDQSPPSFVPQTSKYPAGMYHHRPPNPHAPPRSPSLLSLVLFLYPPSPASSSPSNNSIMLNPSDARESYIVGSVKKVSGMQRGCTLQRETCMRKRSAVRMKHDACWG